MVIIIAFKIYKVTDNDAGNALFMATKNFTYSSDQATALKKECDPVWRQGPPLILRKGGDGAAYKKLQATGKSMLGVPTGSRRQRYAAGRERRAYSSAAITAGLHNFRVPKLRMGMHVAQFL